MPLGITNYTERIKLLEYSNVWHMQIRKLTHTGNSWW